MDNKDNFWDRTNAIEDPLFMAELPDDPQSNPHLAGLMAITGEALQSAEDAINHWKKIGNDHFAEAGPKFPQRYKDAIDAYQKALETPESDSFKVVRAQLYGNIALCLLKLRDFVGCVEAAKKAMVEDPKYVKAYIHAARACLANDLLARCVEFCDQSPESHPALDELKTAAQTKLQKQREVKEAATKAENAKVEAIATVMKSRGIDYSPKPEYNAPGCGLPFFHEGRIMWPVLLLIDEYNTAEVVPEVDETASLSQILEAMFSSQPPWDVKGGFVTPNLEIWANEVKLNPQNSLMEALSKLQKIHAYPVFTVRRV